MTYEEVRNRIAELVPDIKKLEFGCEVLIEGMEDETRFVCEEIRKNGRVWVISSDDESYGVLPIPSYTKVIGRDPSLADVLRAIQMNGKYAALTCKGTFFNKDEYKLANWDLSKPLSGQSQETLDFIGELIKDH